MAKKKQSNNDQEVQLRKQCYQLSTEGKNSHRDPKRLSTDQESGFISGFKRAKSGKPEWFFDVSRAPHNQPCKIDKELEQAIVNSRIKLSKRDTPQTQYAFCGAIAIQSGA